MRFSQNVRDYLTERFDLGEITGVKNNPSDVEKICGVQEPKRTKSVSLFFPKFHCPVITISTELSTRILRTLWLAISWLQERMM